MNTKKYLTLLFLGLFLLSGCTSLNPVEPPAANNPPPNQTDNPPPIQTDNPPGQPNDITVTYNYNNTDKVQLSKNNLVMTVGQKLIIQPVTGLTQNTRFVSTGKNFFGDIMRQENTTDTTKAVFTAVNKGKGKLQIIPNTNETGRAVDLWVTVQ